MFIEEAKWPNEVFEISRAALSEKTSFSDENIL